MQSKVDYIFEFTYSPKWRRSIAVPFDIEKVVEPMSS
jgi:hypothetical protein